MSWSADPLVITVAPTGAEVTRDQTAYLPITPEEIAEEVVRSVNEGASMVHIHARDPDGRPTTDPDVLRRIRDLIRARVDVVINMSTGAEVGMSQEERIQVLDAGPEIASLNLGSMNFGDLLFDNPPALIEALAKRMLAEGIRPELEIYDVGMLATAGRLVAGGLLEEPLLYNFVMGVPGGIAASADNLLALLANRPRPGTWTATGIARDELPLGTLAAVLGGHVRVGFEDNIFYRRGELARSNAQLVARARRIAEELGRPIATAEEARRTLGVSRG
ncbi:MAG TPA: 3-keto-5-aminohexanoate cleavage protein [Actinomycetota bacterium]|jgi:3-keto-5-aminohexanoate cleavage enzyme|nr:3-keto-5-aminohexanoate cleavage protein [Actinomycetota bacterium]